MFNKIEVFRSSIVVNDYKWGDCPHLENCFRIKDETGFNYIYKYIKYDEENHTLTLPRGADISFIERMFKCPAYIHDTYNKYDYIQDTLIKYKPRNDVQVKALKFVVGLDQYETNKRRSQLMLALNTGAGKTYVTIASLVYTGIKSIVITSSINWLEQWSDRVVEYTNIKKNEIFMIQGVASIGRILKMDREKLSKYKLFLGSHNTIKSYGDKQGWDKVRELFEHIRVGCKVYDEAHLNFDNIADIDYNTNVFKTIYLTATPARSSEDENKIYQLYFRNIPCIDLFDEEKDPRTQYVAIKYNSKPTHIEQSNCVNMYGFNKNAYSTYVVNKDNFARLLHIVMDMIMTIGGKTLMYIATNEAISVIYDWILYHYPEFTNDIGIYTTMNKNNKEEALNKRIILSTTKSCGAAMDIKGLKTTVQLAEPIKSKVLSRQSLGRTRDSNTYYIDIIDTGFNNIKNYYIQRLPMFNKYATKCTEIRFNDMELVRKSDELVNRRIMNSQPPKQEVIASCILPNPAYQVFIHQGVREPIRAFENVERLENGNVAPMRAFIKI